MTHKVKGIVPHVWHHFKPCEIKTIGQGNLAKLNIVILTDRICDKVEEGYNLKWGDSLNHQSKILFFLRILPILTPSNSEGAGWHAICRSSPFIDLQGGM